MQSEFGFIVNEDFLLFLHELNADLSNSLRHSGTEHHNLFVSWSLFEDILDISSHI